MPSMFSTIPAILGLIRAIYLYNPKTLKFNLRMPPSLSSAATAAATVIKFTQETVLATLSSYSADWRRALDFHRYVSSPPHSFTHTPSTISLTISILSKHFEFSLARSLLLSSNPNSTLPLRSLLNGLSAARLVSDAISLFNDHKSLTAYHHLIDALCEHRHVSDAVSLALHSPDPPFPADTKIHNLILRGWLRAGSFSQCRLFWSQMDSKRIPKDLHSHSIYMDMLTKSGKPWKAVKLFKEMKRMKSDWVLDVVIYNTAIQATGLAEGPDEGIRVFREMVDAGCAPNLVSWNTVMKLLCREGRIKEGYAWLYEMRKKGCEPDAITYHCFFKYCTRPNEILWLFERMVGSGCRPRMDSYVMLMNKFGRWGFLRPVFMVWEKMKELGVSPDGFAYNAMIDALLEKGMVELAKKFDDEMLEKGLSAKPRRELGTKYLAKEEVVDDDDGDNNAFSGVL